MNTDPEAIDGNFLLMDVDVAKKKATFCVGFLYRCHILGLGKEENSLLSVPITDDKAEFDSAIAAREHSPYRHSTAYLSFCL